MKMITHSWATLPRTRRLSTVALATTATAILSTPSHFVTRMLILVILCISNAPTSHYLITASPPKMPIICDPIHFANDLSMYMTVLLKTVQVLFELQTIVNLLSLIYSIWEWETLAEWLQQFIFSQENSLVIMPQIVLNNQ